MSEKQSLINSRPDFAEALDWDSVKASRVSQAIFYSLLFIAGSVLTFIIGSWLLWSILFGVILVIFIAGFVWAKKSYDYTWYWLTDEGLYIQRGVLWRRKTLVPRNRIQHTDVAQGPLQRHFSIAKLIVYTAGTRDASVTLDGLQFSIANDLREQLRQDGDDDAV